MATTLGGVSFTPADLIEYILGGARTRQVFRNGRHGNVVRVAQVSADALQGRLLPGDGNQAVAVTCELLCQFQADTAGRSRDEGIFGFVIHLSGSLFA